MSNKSLFVLALLFLLLANSACSRSAATGRERLIYGDASSISDSGYESLAVTHDERLRRANEVQLSGLEVRAEPEVLRYVDRFSGKWRRDVEGALDRRSEYWPVLEEVFLEEGLPLALTNVALIESWFKPKARSRRGAVGMWQFTKQTARGNGLYVSSRRDDRKNVEKSTRAAAKHLKYLYDVFADWNLVLAAYNGGVSRVRKAIRRSGTRDFFVLSRRRYLRKETRHFVAKVLAATVITREPSKYGFVDVPSLAVLARPQNEKSAPGSRTTALQSSPSSAATKS